MAATHTASTPLIYRAPHILKSMPQTKAQTKAKSHSPEQQIEALREELRHHEHLYYV